MLVRQQTQQPNNSSSQQNQHSQVDDFDKKEWIRELKQLKKDFILEDRERIRPILNLKRDLKEFYEEFEKEEKKNEISLKKEQSQLVQFIEKQRMDVDCARTMINQSKIEPSYLDKIHSKVKNIEQNLRQFKLKSRAAYEQLVDEESAIWDDLQVWEEKFDQYALEKSETSRIGRTGEISGQGSGRKGLRPQSMSNRLVKQSKGQGKNLMGNLDGSESQMDNGQNQEVDQLESIRYQLEEIDNQLMSNGGINCGWDAADHKDFLRIRTKHNNKINTLAFLQEVMRAVPNSDDDLIRTHISQHERYFDLCEKKKQLLNVYKEVKKDQQKQKISKIDNQNQIYNRLNSDLDLGNSKENNKNLNNQTPEERERLKQEVEKWKKDREEQKKKEIEDKKKQEQLQKLKLLNKLEDERRQKKEQVEEFKYRKEMEKQKEKQIEELEKRRQKEQVLNEEQRQRIYKREEEVFQKKYLKIMEKQLNEEDRQKKLENLQTKIGQKLKDKVESKLNHETKALKDKKREKFDEKKDQRKDAMTMGGNLLGMQARALPFWRQGI